MAEPRHHGWLRHATRVCSRHWLLHGCLEPLHALAQRRGVQDLILANAWRLLERAHAQALAGAISPGAVKALAAAALDQFEVLAQRGDAEAAFQVAEGYRTGFGRPGNHWLALDAYERAAALGHPEAGERRSLLAEHQPIQDDSQARFARQALLNATYGRSSGQVRAQALHQGYRTFREDGIGPRGVFSLFAAAALLAGYITLDFYFLGLGHWRPDPTRVAWGLVGKIHPPREGSARWVPPRWLRADARDVSFIEMDRTEAQATAYRVGDLAGRVVFLHVIDTDHPLLFESQAYLRGLKSRMAGRCDVFVLFLPRQDALASVQLGWLQEMTQIHPCYVPNPVAVRPLGSITRFPMNFVIDRQGRIRQRWVGFGEQLTDQSLAAALAE